MKTKTRIIVGYLLIAWGIGMIYSFYLCAILNQNKPLSQLGKCVVFTYLWIVPVCLGYENIMKAEKKMQICKKSGQKMTFKKRQFMKTFPYFCDNCKKFSHSLYEYCESCGSKNTLRTAKKEDYQMIFQKELTNK